MRRVKTALLALGIALLAVATGCGATPLPETTIVEPPPPPPPPLDEDLFNLVPARPNAVVWIDATNVRDLSIWEVLTFLWNALNEGGSYSIITNLEKTGQINLLEQTEEILAVASDRGEKGSQYVTFLKGSFDTDAIVDILAKSTNCEARDYGKFRGAVTPLFAAVAVTDNTVAFSTEQGIRTIIEMIEQDEAATKITLRDDSDFGDLKLDDSMCMTVRYRRGPKAPSFVSGYGKMIPFVDATRIIAAEISMISDPGGPKLDIGLEVVDPAEAGKLKKKLARLQSQYAENMLVAMFGLDRLLERISISSVEKVLQIALQLDEQDVIDLKRVVSQLEQFRQMANPTPESGEKNK